MLLALDTSTRLASLALAENDTLRAEYTWAVGNNHSVELLRQLERLLGEQHLEMAQLGAVAAAIGPGSFTGVRVAVTVAKTLAFSLKIPLVGISTLDVIAYSQAASGLPVCALLDAGRGEVYMGCYQAGQRQGDHQVLTSERLAEEIIQPTLFCGEIPTLARQTLAERLGKLAQFVSGLASARRAGLLAELAAARLARGEHDDPVTLEPLYLRRPAITVSTKQRSLVPPQPVGAQESEQV